MAEIRNYTSEDMKENFYGRDQKLYLRGYEV